MSLQISLYSKTLSNASVKHKRAYTYKEQCEQLFVESGKLEYMQSAHHALVLCTPNTCSSILF